MAEVSVRELRARARLMAKLPCMASDLTAVERRELAYLEERGVIEYGGSRDGWLWRVTAAGSAWLAAQ